MFFTGIDKHRVQTNFSLYTKTSKSHCILIISVAFAKHTLLARALAVSHEAQKIQQENAIQLNVLFLGNSYLYMYKTKTNAYIKIQSVIL